MRLMQTMNQNSFTAGFSFVLAIFCAGTSSIQNTASIIAKHILFLILILVLCKSTLNFPFPQKLFPLYSNE